ncbi:MAG: hypothetical protein WKG00_35855 [Polyangiaceae bacterium]
MIVSMRLPEVRRAHVLLSFEHQARRVSALLRLDRPEEAQTAAALRDEGFVRDGSALAWARPTLEEELPALCARLGERLGALAIWDAGHVFTNDGHPLPEGDLPPRTWQGPILMHVCSTSRCLVFDRQADLTEVGRVFEAQRSAYYATEFLPSE